MGYKMGVTFIFPPFNKGPFVNGGNKLKLHWNNFWVFIYLKEKSKYLKLDLLWSEPFGMK